MLDADRDAASALVVRALAGDDAGSILLRRNACSSAYGLPIVDERSTLGGCGSEAAADLGFPVVVKSAIPGAHKSEHGGIALDLADEEAVRSAAARIGATSSCSR